MHSIHLLNMLLKKACWFNFRILIVDLYWQILVVKNRYTIGHGSFSFRVTTQNQRVMTQKPVMVFFPGGDPALGQQSKTLLTSTNKFYGNFLIGILLKRVSFLVKYVRCLMLINIRIESIEMIFLFPWEMNLI
jgi:hypothetical protein